MTDVDPPTGSGGRRPPGGAGQRGAVRQRGGAGLLIVVVAVVVGALLLPSATRPPLLGSAPSGAVATTTTVPVPTPTTTSTVSPAAVHVLVANGTTVPNGAGSVAAFLTTKGFGTLVPVDATSTNLQSSAVYAVNGSDPAGAQAVAVALGLPASGVLTSGTPPVRSVANATVVVVLGPDLANRYAGAAGPSSSTTSAGG